MKPEKALFTRRLDAYTLTEVLIVLVIIGILTFLALPNLMPTVTKAKQVEAKEQLSHLKMLEQDYFYEYSRYTKDFNDLGFIQEPLVGAENGHANYRIEVTNASSTGFTATATAVIDFNANGTFNVWQIDQNGNLKEVTPD